MKKTFFYLLRNLEEVILVPSMVIMLLINFINIVGRYFLNVSWAATEEVTVILLAYVSLVGAATAVKRKQHLGFTLILDGLPPLINIIVKGFILVGTVILMVLMFYYGVLVCINQVTFNAATPALQIPMVYASASVPLSAVFITIRVIQDYIRDFKDYRQKEDNA